MEIEHDETPRDVEAMEMQGRKRVRRLMVK